MKKLMLLTLILISAFSNVFSHTLTNQCWNSGQYTISAALGEPNGKIEVTVYTNSSRTTIVQNTQTFFLDNTGKTTFSVNQPVRTTPVYVYVRWFHKNPDGTYSPTYFNNNEEHEDNDGSYNSITTGTNQCQVLALKYGAISARNDKENTIITFQLESTDDTNEITFNLMYPNNVEKKYKVMLMDKLSVDVMWQITINNSTKQYKITKL